MKQKSDQTHLSSGRLQYNLLGSLLKARTGLPEETLDDEEKNGRFPGEGLVHGDEPLVDQLGGHAEGGGGRALAHAGLEVPEPAALDGSIV